MHINGEINVFNPRAYESQNGGYSRVATLATPLPPQTHPLSCLSLFQTLHTVYRFATSLQIGVVLLVHILTSRLHIAGCKRKDCDSSSTQEHFLGLPFRPPNQQRSNAASTLDYEEQMT